MNHQLTTAETALQEMIMHMMTAIPRVYQTVRYAGKVSQLGSPNTSSRHRGRTRSCAIATSRCLHGKAEPRMRYHLSQYRRDQQLRTRNALIASIGWSTWD